MSKKVYTMGINMSNHDRSVAIAENGKIACAISEERLDRRKHSDGFYANQDKGIIIPPFKAIQYCLDSVKIGIDDLDIVVVGRSILSCYREALSFLPIKDKNKIFEPELPYHHLSHAAGALYSSDITDGYVIVADEQGHWINDYEYEYLTLYKVKNRTLIPIDSNFGNYENISFGMFYDLISYSLGFSDGGFPAAGKTMGLSAYGECADYEKRFFDVRVNGVTFNIDNFTEFLYTFGLTKRKLCRSEFPKCVKNTTIITEIAKYIKPISWNTDNAKKIAYIAQKELEKSIVEYIQLKLENQKNVELCSAGGLFLNTNLNSKISNLDMIAKYCPFPAATDDGCAIGLAYLGMIKLKVDPIKIDSFYLGKCYGSSEIENVCLKNNLRYEKSSNTTALIADCLGKNEIVAVFQGEAEFGPRALGNRSILARPDSIAIRDKLNLSIKHREAFRPLAPIVQKEYSNQYFDGREESPYMLFVTNVLDKRLVGVSHYDNTARIQTVTEDQNKLLYGVLSEYYKLSGLRVCINTSFNVNGEPMVETPADAISNFILSDIDTLFMDNYIIRKKDIPLENLKNLRMQYLKDNKNSTLKLMLWHCKSKNFQEALFYFQIIRDSQLFNQLNEVQYIHFLGCAISIYYNLGDPQLDAYIDKLLLLARPKIRFSPYFEFKHRNSKRREYIDTIYKEMCKLEDLGMVKYLEQKYEDRS